MYLTRTAQLYPIQYGVGLKIRRDLRGGNIFHSLRRYARPVGKFVWRRVLKPFLRNNKRKLTEEGLNIIKRLSTGQKPDITESVREILKSKTISDHLRGEGLRRLK